MLYFILQNITDFTQYLYTLTLSTGSVTSIQLNFMGNMSSVGGLVWDKSSNLFYGIGIPHVLQQIDLVSLNPGTGVVTPLNLLSGYCNFLGAYILDPSSDTYYVSITSSLLNIANLTSISLGSKPQILAEVPLQYAPIGAIALP